jgi:hypothetical protein
MAYHKVGGEVRYELAGILQAKPLPNKPLRTQAHLNGEFSR